MQPQDQEIAYRLMLQQYEYLKKLYFSPLSDDMYDEEGEVVPSQYPSKSQIIQRFQTMKVRVPMTPDQPMTPLQPQPQQQQQGL